MLLEVPNIALNIILKESEFRDILILRKVCRSLRNYIDDLVPDAKLTNLEISIQNNNIIVQYGTSGNFLYGIHENGCYVENEKTNSVHIFENRSYENVLFDDLKMVLKHQKSEMEEFNFLHRHTPDFGCTGFLEKMENLLKARTELLKTRVFHPAVHTQDELMAVLPYLDSECLKNVYILNPRFEQPEETREIDRIVELDQWKKVEKMAISAFYISGDYLRQCVYFPQCLVYLESVSMKDLKFLKETYLQFPIFRRIDILYREFSGGAQQTFDSFGVPFEEHQMNGWYFNFPNSEEVLAIFHIVSNPPHFVFNRISRENVVDGAVVQ